MLALQPVIFGREAFIIPKIFLLSYIQGLGFKLELHLKLKLIQMPIIPIKLRFLLIAVLLIGGIIVSFMPYGLAWSWLLLIPGIVLLAGYFMFGTLASASKAVQMNDLDKAEEQLKWTWKPNWMLKMNRGVYHFLLGSISMNRRDTASAEIHMQNALNAGMPTGDYTAQIYLFLAQMAATKNKMQLAKNHIKEAKACDVSEPQVKDAIKQLEKQIKMVPKGHQRMQAHRMRRPSRPR